MCKICNVGSKLGNVKEHDCRMNFSGSAKSMEGQGAQDLAKSDSLKKAGIQIGGFVGDNDTQSLYNIQSVSNHVILKQNDMGHAKKGVKNLLYEIKNAKSRDPDSELTHDSIKYLVKCFAYAVQQNKGKLNDLTLAIKNVPQHVMGKHDNCGNWCSAHKENYECSIRIRNLILFTVR